MYVPDHFALDDDACLDLLRRMGVANLVTTGPGGLTATLLPFQLEGRSLTAHVARNNPQWRHTGEALVILDVQDHYVSPAWLPSSAAGRTVPTWDYVTVHAYGELVAHDDPAWSRAHVRALTQRHEDGIGWSVDDADPAYLAGMLRAVVGVEVRLTRLVGKAKMAQNKTVEDIEALAGTIESWDPQGAAYLREVSLPAARRRADTLARVARRRHGGTTPDGG